MFRTLNYAGATPREISEVVNNAMNGKTNNTGLVTLAGSNATTTTINDERIGYDSIILLTPITINGGNNSVPFGSFQNTASQTPAAANTAYTVTLNTTDVADGVYLSANKIYFRNAGTYNIQFSLQLANSNTQIEQFYIWMAKNGTNLAGTASKFDVNSKHGSSDGYLIAVANFFITVTTNDYIEVKFASTNTTVMIEAYAAQSTPFVMPSVPSSVVTVTLASPVESPYISSRSKGSAVITHYANSLADKTYGYVIVG